MFDVVDDTIVAVATAPGTGARGIVRCSGEGVLSLVRDVFTPQQGGRSDGLQGSRRVLGRIEVEAGCAVPGEVYVFRAPRSYTRQDCVEFHVPGSPVLLTMLVERLIGLGGRSAEPGEFTARAFLNGAMDLSRAEAVAGVIRSRSDAQLRVARRMMEGGLVAETDGLVDELAEITALVEADIDFAEEPIEFITPADLKTRLDRVIARLERLLTGAVSSERIDALPHVLLVGRSNAGKSTLMNRLTGMDRSICSPVAGTTRDLLSAPMSLGSGEAIVFDSAGVDTERSDAAGGSALTLAAAERVDLLCLVVDLTAKPDASVLAPIEAAAKTGCVIVGNKIDVLAGSRVRSMVLWLEGLHRGPVCAVSARTGEGVGRFRAVLADAMEPAEAGLGEDAVRVTARQRESVATSLACVRRCASEASAIGSTVDRADILAFELREALEALGAVAGTVTTDELLGRVFASFCIGK